MAYEGILRACLYRYTRNRADVDELLQDVYAALLTCHTQPTNVRAFVLTAARNMAFDWLRHRNVVPIELLADVEELETLDESSLVDEIIESQQELERFVWAARQLSPRVQQVFVLKKVYGHNHRQIAQRLGISENTVEQHMTRAARMLARILGGEAGMKL
jgi:RNA polymerase sigma-70 factor (ECF subfamily)